MQTGAFIEHLSYPMKQEERRREREGDWVEMSNGSGEN